jgi:spore coat-associated protein N
MKRIIGLAISLAILIGVVGIGTYARFSDNEISSGNQFKGGTLDLKTNNNNGVSQTFYALVFQPGEVKGPQTIELMNTGTVDGATLNIAFSYLESDGSPNTVNMTATQTASIIEVTGLNYTGSSLLNSISDANSNGYKDVQDLKNTSFNGLSGISAGGTKNFDMTIRLRSDTPADYQDDGIEITMTFTLNQ